MSTVNEETSHDQLSRSAREKLRAERRRHQSRSRRRRQTLVIGGVAVVLILAVAIGLVVQHLRARDRVPFVAPKNVTAGGLAYPAGDPAAPVTLTVYEDFRCPACRQFELRYGPVIDDFVRQGKVKVEYRLVTLIDQSSIGGYGSRRAANAVACAQDQGLFRPYHDALFLFQPQETKDDFANNARLIELAGTVPGLKTQAFERCVKDNTHETWVKRVHETFQKDFAGNLGTPTILLNGQNMGLGHKGVTTFQSPDTFRAALDAATTVKS